MDEVDENDEFDRGRRDQQRRDRDRVQEEFKAAPETGKTYSGNQAKTDAPKTSYRSGFSWVGLVAAISAYAVYRKQREYLLVQQDPGSPKKSTFWAPMSPQTLTAATLAFPTLVIGSFAMIFPAVTLGGLCVLVAKDIITPAGMVKFMNEDDSTYTEHFRTAVRQAVAVHAKAPTDSFTDMKITGIAYAATEGYFLVARVGSSSGEVDVCLRVTVQAFMRRNQPHVVSVMRMRPAGSAAVTAPGAGATESRWKW
jgi:hypothetical protein